MPDFQVKTVLYVEDDAVYVLLVRRALQRSKLEQLPNLQTVVTMEDAQRYLLGQAPYEDRVAHPLPSLVLTDLRLPGQSGLQLLQWIRETPQFQHLPVVMLTGSALDEDIQLAYQLGVNFCLVKPDNVDALVSIIQAISIYWVPPPTKLIID
ncbi:response regulator [Anabaena sp. 4-3]|nr:response regulator [Anabaena sp. 4-3]